MSALHLGAGSQKPAEVEGQARLYCMKFCPVAHRVKLILSYKKIPHGIVHINIRNKPEWYSEIQSEGKVPAFVDVDGKVVVNKMIPVYLDEKYPEPPLQDSATNDRYCELLDRLNLVISIFTQCIEGEDKRPFNEITAEIASLLEEFEKELASRGTVFFGGAQPGMLDLLMWPWVERKKSMSLIRKEPMSLDKATFKHLVEWAENMKAQPFVQENECCPEKFARLIEEIKSGKNVDFDRI
ncbi:pyrimidodiazepine synthase [Lasioglossum baleicum]|uniref:pyrimidodiazepine synthase n=1 Tax=Lasioglossum baleicum TaxID=434251 RepID=UPI003FCC5443